MLNLIITLVFSVIWGIVVQQIIYNKNYEENWFWWGFFFGIFALIVALTKPYCESQQEYEYQLSRIDKQREENILKNDGWECANCGKINAQYVGMCSCGNHKSQNESVEFKKASSKDELENIEKIKAYKDLLDKGIITQEEFDEKKKQILGI